MGDVGGEGVGRDVMARSGMVEEGKEEAHGLVPSQVTPDLSRAKLFLFLFQSFFLFIYHLSLFISSYLYSYFQFVSSAVSASTNAA